MEYQITAAAAALILDIFYWSDDFGRRFTSEAHINDVINNYGDYNGTDLSTLNPATVIANSQTGTVNNPRQPNASIIASAATAQNGASLTGFGLTVSQVNTGFYNYVFTNPQPNTNYTVICNAQEQTAGLFTNYTAYVGTKTTTGFQVKMVEGDNGGTQDSASNTRHTLIVVGLTSFGTI